LNVPDYPVPTKSVCDMLDNVRRDVVSLISLQTSIHQKERELANLQSTNGMPQEPQRKGGNAEVVIPHSMLATRGDYWPAPPISQPLPGMPMVSSSSSSMAGSMPGVMRRPSVRGDEGVESSYAHQQGQAMMQHSVVETENPARPTKRRKQG
jgi:hypothetical protein